MILLRAGFIFTTLALLANTTNAALQNPFHLIEEKPLQEVWGNPGFYSYHFDQDKNLDNNNFGAGVEYRYSTIYSVMAGRYHNSDRFMSSYITWLWQPFSMGSIRLGALAGAINGYPRAGNGDWFFMAIPVASYEYNRVGINLTVVPTIKDTVYGSITLQLKLKLY